MPVRTHLLTQEQNIYAWYNAEGLYSVLKVRVSYSFGHIHSTVNEITHRNLKRLLCRLGAFSKKFGKSGQPILTYLHIVTYRSHVHTTVCFWTISTILFLFKTHSISETGFCLRLQVFPPQLGPIDRASPYLRKSGNRD
jgi:hypothetical protein